MSDPKIHDDLTGFFIECDAHGDDVDSLYAEAVRQFPSATVNDLYGAIKPARHEVAWYLEGDQRDMVDVLADPLEREDAREVGVIHERNLGWLDALIEIIEGLPPDMFCAAIEIRSGQARLLARN
jgi:hypothetical protein